MKDPVHDCHLKQLGTTNKYEISRQTWNPTKHIFYLTQQRNVRQSVISLAKYYGHAYIKLVSAAARLGALLDILGVASLLEGLSGHVLLDIGALLPGGGGALPSIGVGAVLLVHILGDGSGDIAANLFRDIVTDLTRSGDIVADLVIKLH